MKQKRPTSDEINDAVDELTVLRDRLEAEGAHFRAAVIGRAINLIKRLAPSKTDGHE